MQSFYISWQQEVLSGESAGRQTQPATSDQQKTIMLIGGGWLGGAHRGAAIEPAETWKIASKQKHRRPSESRRTVQAPPHPRSPAELILRDGTVSYQSEQQRLQIYGPLKLAIKIQRSCSFSRLEEPLGTLVPHRPTAPPSLLWAHVKPLQEHERVRIDWVAVRGGKPPHAPEPDQVSSSAETSRWGTSSFFFYSTSAVDRSVWDSSSMLPSQQHLCGKGAHF